MRYFKTFLQTLIYHYTYPDTETSCLQTYLSSLNSISLSATTNTALYWLKHGVSQSTPSVQTSELSRLTFDSQKKLKETDKNTRLFSSIQ